MADCWLQKKKQPDANVTELVEKDELSATFYLLQTVLLIIKIDGLLIRMFTAYQFQFEDVFFIHFGSRGRSLHGEFYFK